MDCPKAIFTDIKEPRQAQAKHVTEAEKLRQAPSLQASQLQQPYQHPGNARINLTQLVLRMQHKLIE